MAAGEQEADPITEQHARYIADDAARDGLPLDPDLQLAADYDAEEVEEDGVKQRGKNFEMPLLDADQRPTGEKVLVHLDWLMPKNDGGSPHRKPVGSGYRTTKGNPKELKYVHKRYTAQLYGVWEEQGNNRWRLYVVLLPKAEAKE
jgi:hypothetical protein